MPRAGRWHLQIWDANGLWQGTEYDLRWDDLPTAVPEITVAVSPGSTAENGSSNLVYTFTRSTGSGEALTVSFDLGGTANFGEDFILVGATTFSGTSGTVTFAAGSTTANIVIDPIGDGAIEPDETVMLSLAAGADYTLGTPDAATGTIVNDDFDPPPAVILVEYGDGDNRWVTLAELAGRPAPWKITMIRVTFDVDDRGFGVLRLVPDAVHQDAAGHGAIRACIAGLGRTRQLERPDRSGQCLACAEAQGAHR